MNLTPGQQHLNKALEKIKTLNIPPPKKTSGWTDAELIGEARDIVVKDLMASFKSDVKNRLISGKVWEYIAAWETSGSQGPTAPSSPVKPELVDSTLDSAPILRAGAINLKSLPSFSKRRPGAAGPSADTRRRFPYGRRFSSEAPSESPDPEPTPPPPAIALQYVPLKKAHASDKKAASKGKAHLDYTSSDDDGNISDEVTPTTSLAPNRPASLAPIVVDVSPLTPDPPFYIPDPPLETPDPSLSDSPPPMAAVDEPSPVPAPGPVKHKRGAGKKHAKVEPAQPLSVLGVADIPLDEIAVIIDEVVGIPTPAPTDTTASTTKRDLSNIDSDREGDSDVVKTKPKGSRARTLATGASKGQSGARSPTPDPFDCGVAADEEDLFYLKLAIQRPRMGSQLHPTPPASEDENEAAPRHPSGSARTEGYYAITVAERMANRPSSNKAKAAIETAASGTSGVAVSRLARANTRGLVRGMELHKKVTATDTDVLKFNQLRTRKKQLTFSRSGIEGYGLFAME